tara:strand:- start:2518 stop:2688 length:171 start_codon:yes stop_codon:yes gene_type:complete
MKIQEHMITSIVLKLENIKTQIENKDNEGAISGIDLLLRNLNRFETNESDSKKKAK